jgi:glutathione S-transferase
MRQTLPRFELVSFSLCPYVQRAVITLKLKKVPFELKSIDLRDPPQWFRKISPMGKVPVLVVDQKTPLFESAVINEYLDEITEPRLNPLDPLQKARERAWIEYGSEVFADFYRVYTAETEPEFNAAVAEMFDDLQKLDSEVAGPWFRGADFSLVDTSFAPLFLRLQLIPKLWNHEAWTGMPKVRSWADALIRHPVVRESCPPDFEAGMVDYVKASGDFLFPGGV